HNTPQCVLHRRRTSAGQDGGQQNAWLSSSTRGAPQPGLSGLREPDARARARRPRTRIVVEHRPPPDRRLTYIFFSSFLNSAFIFCQKDSFGAFLHSSMRTGITFSVASTSRIALWGLPPLP